MQFVWKYVDELVGRGLDWIVIAELLFLVSATTVSLALPLAILFSSLMTFGNLGEFSELTAIKASGISLTRAMRPIFLFCAGAAVFAYYFANNVQPIANLKMRTLLHDIQEKRPELNIKPGIFNSDLQDYVIRIGEKSRDGSELTDIMIYDHSSRSGNDRLIIASKGFMNLSDDKQYLELRLLNGSTYTEAEPGRRSKSNLPFLREYFEEDLIRFDLSLFKLNKSDENLFKRNYQMLNQDQLLANADTLKIELGKSQEALLRMVFRGTFFIEGEQYSTTLNLPRKSLSEKDSLYMLKLRISEQVQKQIKDPLAARMRTADTSSRRQLMSDFIVPGERYPLTDSTEVLNNYARADRIRILETASNTLRNSKSSVDFAMENFRQEQERINKHYIEWHRKFTLSFACIVLFLIGAPLGAIVRKGGLGMPVVFSLIFFVLYHMISITGEKLARESVVSPVAGMWLSSFILLPVGLFLSYKATNDSALFDRGAYLKSWTKLKSAILRPFQPK